MRSSITATAQFTLSAIVSVIVGLIAAKAWALLLGPPGLGLMALMQQFVAFAVAVVGVGLAPALVRAGAQALSRGDQSSLAALRQGALLASLVFGVTAAVLVLAGREAIGKAVFGREIGFDTTGFLAVAIPFTLTLSILTATLNLHQKVTPLASVNVFNVVFSTAFLLLTVSIWAEKGIAPGLALGAAASCAVAALVVWRSVPSLSWAPVAQHLTAARSLVKFGAPYMLASLVGPTLQLALPVLVLRTLGRDSVGFYRSAAVASAYLGMFLAAAALEYYPRVSAADPANLAGVANSEFRLIVAVGFPVILFIFAFAGLLLPLVYSPAFVPAVPLLQWQMVGDLVRFATWSFGYSVLARRGSTPYLLAETVAALVTVGVSAAGVTRLGVTALGQAYLLGQVAFFVVILLFAFFGLRVSIHRANLMILLATLAAVLSVQLLAVGDWSPWRLPATIGLLVAATAVGSAYLKSQLKR